MSPPFSCGRVTRPGQRLTARMRPLGPRGRMAVGNEGHEGDRPMTHPMNRRLARAVVIPVVRMRDAAHAETAVQVLADSGIDAFEMTMTTPGALRLIERLRAKG